MRTKKAVCFFSVILLFSGLMCSVDALSDTTVSFRGGGVTIDLAYPEEAHPNTTITHDVTITANINLTSINIGILIYAPVNSTLQLIKNQPLSWGTLLENQSLPTSEIPILLPEQANGTLYCIMTVQTDQTADALSYKFYSAQVREMTYSELLEDYNVLNNTYYQLLADYGTLNNTYNNLQSSYAALNSSYNELSDNCSILNNIYNDLLVKYTTLENNYNELDSRYNNVNSARNSLLGDYSELQSDYDLLNSTHYSLIETYNSLQAVYDALNQTYTDLLTELNDLQQRITFSENALNSDRIVLFIFVVTVACLIAFIVYLKRKKEEPYVVIRKETVSMKSEED